jgi:hypothetical protein
VVYLIASNCGLNDEFIENLHTVYIYFFQKNISMEETQILCTEEIEIKTDVELSSCSPEEDEKADTR